MQTVRDADGNRYLLVKESSDASLVRDPATGDTKRLPTDALEVIDGESSLETAASSVPDAVRRVVTAVHDERALGLLVEIDERGPVAVETLLTAYDLCESDLHGLLAEFRAAGLLTEQSVHGRRGYEITELAAVGLAALGHAED